MKPLQLTMKAFGPYKNKEYIDFTRLEGNQLFVISGATGAGKTTIFDAICFALYGTASGGDRENVMMLRSDFAHDDIHTSVELIFELSNRTYRVLRQLGHVKEGNKSRTGERYEFFEIIDGDERPAVDRQIVTEINEKIETLIGLTEDQFKQIVMLPQGEFRKLLTSETENKEDILRRLFKTKKYKRMTHLLKDKTDALANEHETYKQHLEHHIQSIQSHVVNRENSALVQVLNQAEYNVQQLLHGLEKEAAFYEEKIKSDEENYKNYVEKHERKQNFVQRAKMINERFHLLKEREKSFALLKNEQEKYVQKENKLAIAKRANQIEPYEKQLKQRREELARRNDALKADSDIFTREKAALKEITKQYKEEKERAPERERLHDVLKKYNEYLPIVKEMNDAKLNIKRSENTLKSMKNELETIKKEVEKKSQEAEKITAEINENDKRLHVLNEKRTTVKELKVKYKLFESYRKRSLEHITLRKTLDEKEQQYKRAKRHYEEKESEWLHNQAVVLASHLKSGEHCPVCGSTHHPQKATSDTSHVSKEVIDELKEKMNVTNEQYNEALTNYRTCSAQLKDIAKEIETYDVALEHVVAKIDDITKEGKQLTKEITDLEEKLAKNYKLKKDLQSAETFIKTKTTKIETKEKAYEQTLTNHTTLQATFKERIRNIDKEMQDLSVLKDKIKQTETMKDRLERRWHEAEQQLQQKQATVTKAQANVLNAEKNLKETAHVVKGLQLNFQEQLKKHEFTSEQHYVNAKMDEVEFENVEKEIKAYNEQVLTLQKQIEDLSAELKEERIVDIKSLEEHLLELKKAYEQALTQLNTSKQQYTFLENMKKTIVQVEKQKNAVEKELSITTDLYDTVRGQNERRISFERYLQIDYLEQITHAANERFKQLSNGQFYLMRSNRQEAYGRQSGLAIDVYDAYTGQTRDVKTLSGGEKFIASLCLALGMSDVIQSYEGSISIDTMFIDEGFGSLDEESLYKSIDALIDLQETGRTIGVISHVEELKTIFPAMLEVTKTKEGHSETTFVLK